MATYTFQYVLTTTPFTDMYTQFKSTDHEEDIRLLTLHTPLRFVSDGESAKKHWSQICFCHHTYLSNEKTYVGRQRCHDSAKAWCYWASQLALRVLSLWSLTIICLNFTTFDNGNVGDIAVLTRIVVRAVVSARSHSIRAVCQSLNFRNTCLVHSLRRAQVHRS